MVVINEFGVLLLGVKNKKLGIRLEKNICQKKEDKIQLKQTGDHITKQEEWLEAFLDDKSAFLQNRGS